MDYMMVGISSIALCPPKSSQYGNDKGKWDGITGPDTLVLAPNGRLYYNEQEVQISNPILNKSMAMDYIMSMCYGLKRQSVHVSSDGKLIKYDTSLDASTYETQIAEDWDFIYHVDGVYQDSFESMNQVDSEEDELIKYIQTIKEPRKGDFNSGEGGNSFIDPKGTITAELIGRSDYTNTVYLEKDMNGLCNLALVAIRKEDRRNGGELPEVEIISVGIDTNYQGVIHSSKFKSDVYIEYFDGVIRVLPSSEKSQFSDIYIHSCKITYEKS